MPVPVSSILSYSNNHAFQWPPKHYHWSYRLRQPIQAFASLGRYWLRLAHPDVPFIEPKLRKELSEMLCVILFQFPHTQETSSDAYTRAHTHTSYRNTSIYRYWRAFYTTSTINIINPPSFPLPLTVFVVRLELFWVNHYWSCFNTPTATLFPS